MSLYDELGVERGADEPAIKAAYRRRAKKAHPDAGGSPEEFERLNRAKLVLLDPRRRKEYDDTGRVDEAADDELARAMNLVTSAIEQVLSRIGRNDPRHFDIVGDAKKLVGLQIDGTKSLIAQNEQAAKTARAVAKRFGAKKGKVNRLTPLFEARVRQIEEGNAGNRRNLAAMERAYNVLNEHTFEHDKRQAAANYFQFTVANNSSSW